MLERTFGVLPRRATRRPSAFLALMLNLKALQGKLLVRLSKNDEHQEKVDFALVGEDSNIATTVFDNFSRVR
jgi:hypothetical protein